MVSPADRHERERLWWQAADNRRLHASSSQEVPAQNGFRTWGVRSGEQRRPRFLILPPGMQVEAIPSTDDWIRLKQGVAENDELEKQLLGASSSYTGLLAKAGRRRRLRGIARHVRVVDGNAMLSERCRTWQVQTSSSSSCACPGTECHRAPARDHGIRKHWSWSGSANTGAHCD